MDLSSRARPGGADIRGGAAVSMVLSPDGEALPPLLPPQGQHAVVKAALSMAGPRSVGASAQEARPLLPLLPVPQGQHVVERAALSVERVLMALAQKARPRLKPHHPSRLPTQAPGPGHQCAAPVKGGGRLGPLPHPPREYGLSQRSACAFSSFVVDLANFHFKPSVSRPVCRPRALGAIGLGPQPEGEVPSYRPLLATLSLET